jgi:hypothetical protein
MKTIAVIGASGKSGRAFVLTALKAGYAIRAGIHTSNSLPQHKNLTVVRIDATDFEDVKTLIKGSDVVVSLIGHVKKSPASLQTDTTINIVRAMDQANLKRFISLTGSGVRFPGDMPSLPDRLLNAILKIVMKDIINDGVAHAKVLQDSSLGWTIIRGLILTEHSAQDFTLTEHGPAKLLCPREEIALGILQLIENNSFVKKAVTIS